MTKDELIAIPKDFKFGKVDRVREEFWKNVKRNKKLQPISLRTIEKLHYLRMKKTIDKLFYE